MRRLLNLPTALSLLPCVAAVVWGLLFVGAAFEENWEPAWAPSSGTNAK